MAKGILQFARAAGLGCVGAVTLTLGVAASIGGAWAQQAPAKKAPAPAAPAQKGAAAPAEGSQSAWVKLCEKATAVTKKDGKEEKKDLNICLTHHERLDGNTGMVLVSAAVRQIESQDKQHFMVMVPLGMLVQPGMRATVYPKDAWEKVQKQEKVDESKLKVIKLAYTLCHPAGCTAETELTADLLNDLKTGGGLVVLAINAGGAPVGFPVPLVGFDGSYSGSPVDAKLYSEARKALMQQIAERQHELAEEHKKQQESAAAGKQAPPPAKATTAPAKK
jgi:invasion protein IalB